MCCLEHRARNYTPSKAARKRFFNIFFGHAKEPWKAARQRRSRRTWELFSHPPQLLQRPDGSVVWMGIVALRCLERGHGLLHVAEAGAEEAV